jgi:beta-lactam-binding protein with PASTA domain
MLGGRYVIEGRVGGGGMANVYRGVDTFLRRQVALKVLRPQFAGDADFVVRFRREARSAAMLSHPNIVAVYDVGQEGDDCYYIVQEFVDGRTLKEQIEQDGPLSADAAVDVGLQVLRALGAAHAAGVIHRDVKPQNVLLTKDGRVKVTDFGIARAEAGVTMAHSGAIVGTAHYAAPEQVQGRPTDLRCDLYSTGVMLFEAVTGRVPFDGEGALAVALQHVQAPPPDPATLRPGLPEGLRLVIGHAMAKAPEQRYASTAEFESDLLDVRAGKPPRLATAPSALGALAAAGWEIAGAPPPPRPEPVRRGRGLLRAAGAAAGVVVGLGLVVGGGLALALHLLLVRTVAVPDVAGDSLLAAEQAMRQAGLQYIVDPKQDQGVPQGAVIDTVPAAGSPVREGFAVEIYQSLGPPQVQVPDLTGLSEQAAETELSGMGLAYQVASTPQFSSTVLAGSVVASDPPSGSEVASGATVTLTLSAGPSSAGLPDYVGQPATSVEQEIAQAGWTLGTTTEQKSGWPQGIVVATTPAAGAALLPGQAVGLEISSGCVYQQVLHLRAAEAAAPPPGGVAPGTPGFSETASASAASGSGASSSGASASGSGPAALQETVLVSDVGLAAPPRREFDARVAAGQPFDVTLCWSSPQGAAYTWLEDGVTRAMGVVGGGAGAGTPASGTGGAGAASG